MKKLFSAVLALAMMLTLVACGNYFKNDADNNDADNNEPEVVAAPDLLKFYEDYMTSLGEDNTPMMMPADAEMLDAFFAGLRDIPLNQCVVMLNAMSGAAFEFALVECENAEDVEAVKEIFKARKAYQIEGGAFYPMVAEQWETAVIVTHGNCVALIVTGDTTSDAVAAFNALFN